MKKKLTAEEEKQRNIRWIRALFLVYLLIVIKLIIFKYPMDQLRAIAATWRKDVILEGLDTANFTPFKTIRMYIDYAYMLNSFENLVGNILVFVPFGFLLPYVWKKAGSFWVMLLNAVIFVLGIEVFQLFSAFGAFDVDDRNESINNYDNNSLTLKQTYSYDYIGCDDQFVEKYQF